MRKLLLAFLFAVVGASAATVASNGSLSDVNTKITAATAGDIITVPSGSFTWGTGGTSVAINKSVTLLGLSGATINLAADGPVYGAAVISVTANNVTISNLVINGIIGTVGGPSPTPIGAYNVTGFRLTGTTYNGPAAGGYFLYAADVKGVADNCTINGGHGSLQTFMIRGATSVWSADHTMGSANAFYIEDCTFAGTIAYLNENDGSACSVIRYNQCAGAYADAHMIETATDASGVAHGSRQLEVYNNTWGLASYYNMCEISGGTAILFDNTVPTDTSENHTWAVIEEWGAHVGLGGDGLAYVPTPAHSPIPDQPGMGKYPQSAGQEPVYYFNNKHVDGTNLDLFGSSVSGTAITAYGSTFVMTSDEGSPYMLLAGRDYVEGTVGGSFPSTTQVGRGTRAAMLASSPTAAGQGWWVTDEGSWNTNLAANTSGQLYKWSGSAWALYYTPYTYPHPLRGGSSSSPTIATTSLNVTTLQFP